MECAFQISTASIFERSFNIAQGRDIFPPHFSNFRGGSRYGEKSKQQLNSSLKSLEFTENYSLPPPSSSITIINSTFDTPETHLLQPLSPKDETDTCEVILPVECGSNRGLLYLSKLCQGSKGQCILHCGSWLTPNEFQLISGRVTAKDWKRSIRHNGKSLKLLISKGALSVHSPLCDCGNHQQGMELLDQLNYNNANGLNNHHHKLLTTMSNNTSSTTGTTTKKRANGTSGPIGVGANSKTRLTSIIDSLLVSRTHEGSQSCSSSESEFGFEIPTIPGCGIFLENKNFKQLSPPLERKPGESGEKVGETRNKKNLSQNSPSAEPGDEEPQQLGNSTTNQNSNLPSMTSTASSNSTATVMPPTTKSRTSKKQRAPPIKSERQSPESVRSSPSPSKPPSNGGGSRGPSPPLRPLEHGMGRNCTDYIRSMAAKYNYANPHEINASARSSPFNFDTRFLKPGAAAAAASLLAFQQQHADKLQFPLIDMSSTQTLLSMVRSAAASAPPNSSTTPPTQSNGLNSQGPTISKRATSPLDLSSAAALVGLSAHSPPKKSKSHPGGSGSGTSKRCGSNCSGCSAEGEGIVSGWTVEDVCRFVGSIDLCAEYMQAFRDHSIDGSSLPLLTEEHLMQNMSMKLGPALKFKSTVAKKLGNCPVCRHCAHCHLPAENK